MNGTVFDIFIAESPESDMRSLAEVSLVAGKGIEGDRYFYGKGTFSEKLKDNPSAELTLIEKEEVDNFNINHKQNHQYGDFRRNIVTEGFRLNDFVGKDFTIGDVKLKGIRLCEPCTYLAETVNPLVLPCMVGVAGLRAQIIMSGTIRKSDIVKGELPGPGLGERD